MMEKQNDLIAALATPDMVSAISVVRLSGKGASATVEKLMKIKPGRLTGRKRVVGDFAGIDYLVAISWAVGKSYTGEEMVDLMCHGSPGTAKRILEELERSGARLALSGEFTRRAWMNGRMTSLDVLALSSEYSGQNAARVNSNLSKELSDLTSEVEGFIEFSEDHEVSGEEQISGLLSSIQIRMKILLERVRSVETLPKVFIMGPVNAGKSTLFNKLNGKETAVVSSAPGTTRDGASRLVNVDGRQLQLSDTAGFGGGELDGKALNITQEEIKTADRIVWMDPLCKQPPENITQDHSLLLVCSLADRKSTIPQPGWLPFSTVTEMGMAELTKFIVATENNSPSWRLERIVNLLSEAITASDCNDIALAAEIVREVLVEADEQEFCGDAVERALERFCVGK